MSQINQGYVPFVVITFFFIIYFFISIILNSIDRKYFDLKDARNKDCMLRLFQGAIIGEEKYLGKVTDIFILNT